MTGYTERNCFPYMREMRVIQTVFQVRGIKVWRGIRKRCGFRTSHCLYRKLGVSVRSEMRVDSKHRNVGFLALSGLSVAGGRPGVMKRRPIFAPNDSFSRLTLLRSLGHSTNIQYHDPPCFLFGPWKRLTGAYGGGPSSFVDAIAPDQAAYLHASLRLLPFRQGAIF